MKKLTKREAIRECKRKYRAIMAGEPIPERFEDRTYWGYCPLCQYKKEQEVHILNGNCNCPFVQQYGFDCMEEGTNFSDNPKEFANLVFGLKE